MKVLALAGDAGGARAILPVIRLLRSDPTHSVTIHSYAAARQVWAEAGIESTSPDPAVVKRFDRVLLGTSWQDEQWEQRIILEARKHSIRSVSVLDGWANYRVRFVGKDDALILPDAIAVMDHRATQEMEKAGFPTGVLHVTGQPAFEEALRYRQEDGIKSARERVARTWHLQPGESCFLFASQPFSTLGGDPWGFDEIEVLKDLVAILGQILAERERSALMLVKRHPRESGPNRLPVPTRNLRLAVVEGEFSDYRELISGTDGVLGMNSNLLFEACLIGVPVVSYQPNLLRPDPLPTNAWGWSQCITSREMLKRGLEREFFNDTGHALGNKSGGLGPLLPNAAVNVLSLLMQER